MPVVGAMTVVAGLVVGGFLAHAGPGAAVGVVFPTPQALQGVAVVTCAFMLMWYTMLGHQVQMKFGACDGQDKDVATQAALVADRSVANTLEQAIPFLSLLWLHAIFVNPETSKVLGWIYVVTRFFYPWTYGFYGQFNTAVELVTQPNYVVIFYFLIAVWHKCASGDDLHTKVHDASPWLMLLLGVAVSFVSFIFFLGVAALGAKIIVRGVAKDMGKYVAADESEYEEE